MISRAQRRQIKQLQNKYGIAGKFNSLGELKNHITGQRDEMKNKAGVAYQKNIWMNGELDNISDEQIKATGADVSTVRKLSKDLPVGAVLTFGKMNGILEDSDNLVREAKYLKKFFWDRDLVDPNEISTGVTRSGSKKTGGYWSATAAKERKSGDLLRSESQQYSDAVPYGYNDDPKLAEKISNAYNEVKRLIPPNAKI